MVARRNLPGAPPIRILCLMLRLPSHSNPDLTTTTAGHHLAPFLAKTARQLLGKRQAGSVVIDSEDDAVEPFEIFGTGGDVGDLCVVRLRLASNHLFRRPVRHRDDIANAGLFERQLIELALDNDRAFDIGNVVEPIEDLLGALHLRKLFLSERSELDVYHSPPRKYGKAMHSTSVPSAGM